MFAPWRAQLPWIFCTICSAPIATTPVPVSDAICLGCTGYHPHLVDIANRSAYLRAAAERVPPAMREHYLDLATRAEKYQQTYAPPPGLLDLEIEL